MAVDPGQPSHTRRKYLKQQKFGPTEGCREHYGLGMLAMIKFQKTETKEQLFITSEKRYLTFLAHIMQKDAIEILILAGRVEGMWDKGEESVAIYRAGGNDQHHREQKSESEIAQYIRNYKIQ